MSNPFIPDPAFTKALPFHTYTDWLKSWNIYELVDGSRAEQYGQFEFTATVNFICDWDLRYACMALLSNLSYPLTSNHSAFFLQRYYDPVVTGISVSVYEDPGANTRYPDVRPTIDYRAAKLAVSYKAPARPTSGSIKVQFQPSVEGRQLPAMGHYWESDRSPIQEDQAPIMQEFSLMMDVSISAAEFVPDWLWLLNGAVNKDNFSLFLFPKESGGTRIFPKGSLLFTLKQIDTSGTGARDDRDMIWDIGFSYHYKPFGWNKFRRLSSLLNLNNDTFYDQMVNEVGDVVQMFPEMTYPNWDLSSFFSE